MDTKEPFLILLVLFILVGLAYSPFKEANQNKNSNGNPSSSVGVTSGNLGNSSNKEIAENIRDAEENIKRLEENLNKKIDEKNRSPYYGKIRMSNISGLYGDDPSQEYTYLSTNLSKNETIKITDWYLKSEITGYYATIGKASLLPFPFAKTESDVVLQQMDRVVLTKGFSPIGISFRTNKCTGYFEENRTFVPSLSLQCPEPRDEKLPVFSGVYDRNDECLDIIERIPRCTTKGSQFIRDLPDTVPSSCKTYLTTQINYNTCVAIHFGDTDFPSDEYRIYLNKFGPLWRKKQDKINLHDENGLVVDSISY
ncbi:MAG: hypothetical protein A3A96_02985 [Candidatus Zambryskibacteria bacterium RIFCSPLOWO2_01_FULL_39_39]|uniref:LTD domain-containing protein n=1 Tax=Candidatus Zambryskibacteria bacterium RIFCSPLOWO2_01_FULL_39_39 TaxID=1802758 RepID=A0A1G2TW99_9BACT|nr:MAG: hypothetical protein UT00_C0002G0026 [Parcubacteria group bacterium GW2011_GWA1_38_7]OHA86872.1 MAG: hypothetical protein A2644_00115 [Candidatus Zambryskibacteria bacterium RIFCSPHIGHO2_01_FULL_39_63]OHA94438.1 MAG: hypothetical protein A3B88_01935 [Candidatus Zambryskibacteria bacterium RIFCSPHIGHO2_02_FULL_39_19]OHA98969.1 MAG: hypothetical protein A3F20_00260 [Candidatus Zambryskibacteria bacterium RIFCSPHIGHO2_12_FULL_39_21]OHB01608.1 MAG: hypothetical protein A3A96_02985 [Candidat